MRVRWKDFESAVLAHIGHQLGPDLATARSARFPDEETPEEFGLVEAAAILAHAAAGADHADALQAPLVSVGFISPGRCLTFAPEVARVHPLLSRWLSNTLGNAVVQSLLAGALLTNVATDAPTFRDVLIEFDGWGNVQGSMALSFEGQVQAICYFGQLAPATGFITSRRISAEALHAVGASLPLVSGAPHEAEQDTATEAADFAAVSDALASAFGAGVVH